MPYYFDYSFNIDWIDSLCKVPKSGYICKIFGDHDSRGTWEHTNLEKA